MLDTLYTGRLTIRDVFNAADKSRLGRVKVHELSAALDALLKQQTPREGKMGALQTYAGKGEGEKECGWSGKVLGAGEAGRELAALCGRYS